MAEYIDREKLMKEFCRTCDNGRMLVDEPCIISDTCTGLALLRNFQTEDVMPVVRCKDCKHLMRSNAVPGIIICKNKNGKSIGAMSEDGFCDCGEKADEEG